VGRKDDIVGMVDACPTFDHSEIRYIKVMLSSKCNYEFWKNIEIK
jgi:hypothetical protein